MALTAVEPQLLKQLIARNTPVLYLHPADSYMPCSVEFFMQNSELCAAEHEGEVSQPCSLPLLSDHACPAITAAHAAAHRSKLKC